MKRLFSILTSLIFIFMLFGCQKSAKYTKHKPDKINIVCTVFPQYDFAQNIASNCANITMLIPPGSEAHTYEPAPRDILCVKNADLLITVGGESETWAQYIINGITNKKVRVLKMLDIVNTLEEETVEGMENHHHEEYKEPDENMDHEVDEHVWTSPDNAVIICNKICDILCEIDPQNSKTYKSNTIIYTKKLAELSNEFKSIAQKYDKKTLVFADRFPFRYLTELIGLKYYAAFPGCSAQTEPSASTMTYLADKVSAEKISAVICVDFGDGRIAQAISSQTKSKTYRMYSCHNISKKQFKNGESYISLMKHNALVLKEALK